jgi:hypothetical protein
MEESYTRYRLSNSEVECAIVNWLYTSGSHCGNPINYHSIEGIDDTCLTVVFDNNQED